MTVSNVRAEIRLLRRRTRRECNLVCHEKGQQRMYGCLSVSASSRLGMSAQREALEKKEREIDESGKDRWLQS